MEFDHLPVEALGLVDGMELAEGPAGVVGGVDDVGVLGHVLDVLDVFLGHFVVFLGLGEGLVDAGDLGEGHVVEGAGGGDHGVAVGGLGVVEFGEDGEGVAAHDGGFVAEVVVGVVAEPGGDVGGAALVVFEGVAAAGGAVGGLGGVDGEGVFLGVGVEVGEGFVVLAGVVEADGHPVADVGGEDVVGVFLQPVLEAGDGVVEVFLHGEGEGKVEFDARALGMGGEALEELAHFDFGILELLEVDEGFGAEEGDGGDVEPFVAVFAEVGEVFVAPGEFVAAAVAAEGEAVAAVFEAFVEQAGFAFLELALLGGLGPGAEALGLGAALHLAEAVEFLVDAPAVGHDGGGAVDAGEAVLDEEFGEVVLADLDDAEVALLLGGAHGVFPAGPDGEFLAGKGALGEFLAHLADGDDLGFLDAEVVGLVAVAFLVGLVGFGGVDEVEADDDVLVGVADVEAVAVHVAVGEDAVFELVPLAGDGGVGGAGEGRQRERKEKRREDGSRWEMRLPAAYGRGKRFFVDDAAGCRISQGTEALREAFHCHFPCGS